MNGAMERRDVLIAGAGLVDPGDVVEAAELLEEVGVSQLADRTFGTLSEGVLRGWWCEVPSRQPGADAGEVELRFDRSGDGLTVDGRWRYGGTDGEIYYSIFYGRPKGMPAWGGTLPSDAIWQLVSYLQSLQPAKDTLSTTSW